MKPRHLGVLSYTHTFSLLSNRVIAVKQGDADQAKEAMQRVWTDETLGGKTRLKVDYPD